MVWMVVINFSVNMLTLWRSDTPAPFLPFWEVVTAAFCSEVLVLEFQIFALAYSMSIFSFSPFYSGAQ